MCTQSSTIIWISGLKVVYTVNQAKQRSTNVDFTFLCVCARDVYGCRLVYVCVRVRVHVQSRFGCRSSQWRSTGCFGISSVSLRRRNVRLIPDFACVKEHEWFVF